MAKKKSDASGLEAASAKNSSPAVGFQYMVAAVIAIALIESALAGFGAIPPILSYSPANIFFAFLRLAIVVYAGAEYASSGITRAALRGGALFLASSTALCISVSAAPYYATHPVLGVFVLDGQMPALFATIILENTLVGAAIALAVAWLSGQKIFQKFLWKVTPKKN